MNTREEKLYKRFMRERYSCAVGDVNCCHLKDVVWLDHDRKTLIGNSLVLCRQHSLAGYCTALSKIGRVDFEEMFNLDLHAIAQWCQQDHEGQLALGEPPRGVNYAE